jgi:arylsulfatase A-like enzyme
MTGTLPWTHRAINHNDTVAEDFVQQNLFSAFSAYHRIAYSHNPLVNTLLAQFLTDIETYIPREKLFLESDGLINLLFKDDEDIATLSWTRAVKSKEEGYTYSLFLNRLYAALKASKYSYLESDFPRGLPAINQDNHFILEDGIDWLKVQVIESPQPFLVYTHFLPPHHPYKTRVDFYGRFEGDGFRPPEKPEHIFAQKRSIGHLDEYRAWYDEFLLYVDTEFARLYDYLESTGLLENTWLVFTSDHGELFERGITGHLTPLLHQPVIQVPLLIFPPGQRSRVDIHQKTDAIDLLPTLLYLTGQEVPNWVEGEVMPPYQSKEPGDERDIFAVQAKGVEKEGPIIKATVMLVRGRHKLMYYSGYRELEPKGELIELFDLEDDPNELVNLYPERKKLAGELLDVVKAKLAEVNRPYL